MALSISGSSPSFTTYQGGVVTSGTNTATTSGTSVALSTTVPSWAKRITVMFNGVAQNSTSPLQLQIGSGSYTTSGYNSLAEVAGSSVGSTTSTSGFLVNYPTAAAETLFGSVTICLQTANTWVESGTTMRLNAGTFAAYMSAGSVALSGALDRIQITTVGGSATFSAGSINILYE